MSPNGKASFGAYSKGLLANRDKGKNNRIRAVFQTKEETFSSDPVSVAVGFTVLTVVDQMGNLTVAAMIDNSRIPFYDFQAKVVVPGRARRTMTSPVEMTKIESL